MKIDCEVSLGELIDKLSILMIKEKMIQDETKVLNVKKEKLVLENILKSLNLKNVDEHINSLYEVNLKLWNIEDDIREKERAKEFDQKFIELARSVYITNDERFNRKNKINLTFSSNLVEVKSYKEY